LAAEEAVEKAIGVVNSRMSPTFRSMGLIAVDRHGGIGASHNSPNMCWAYVTSDSAVPVASLTGKIVK
jgi:isoaspartyl peptidase/L-asparaginase-like protein (Ntn-hydrolase superfamily)